MEKRELNLLSGGSREEVLERQSPLPGNVLERPHRLQSLDGGLGVVQSVVTAQLLSESVLDSSQLEHSAHGSSSDDTSSLSGRAKHDTGGSEDTVEPVREGRRLGQRDSHQVALGIHGGLLHGHHDLLRGRTSDANGSVLVSDHHNGPESKLLSSLNDLGNTTNLNDPVPVGEGGEKRGE